MNGTGRDEAGFTLLELLVVVIIIGVLAAVAIPAFLNQRERAWQAELTSIARNIALGAESLATAAGGNYERALGATPAAVLGTIDGLYADLNGGDDTDPLVFTTAAADGDSFAFCGAHIRIDSDDDGAPGAGDHNVTYDSDGGGLQRFVPGTGCPAAITP